MSDMDFDLAELLDMWEKGEDPPAVPPAVPAVPPAMPAVPPAVPIAPPAGPTHATLRDAMARAVDACPPGTTLATFRKAALDAWRASRPAPAKTNPAQENPFHPFLREHIAAVRRDNPDATHNEHMKILGKMWKGTKRPRPSEVCQSTT